MFVKGLILYGILQTILASTIEVPRVKMLDGNEMPTIALGTYLGFDEKGVVTPKNNLVRDVIAQAINLGYRHIDTASVYGTEQQIGEAIRMKIQEGVIKREDIFLTTKLWNTAHKREQVAVALKESLNKTGLDYVDLYLVHWPMGLNANYSYSDVDYMETWMGMEDIQRLGLAKSIGVSNFNKEQLQRVIKESSIKPAALEIEVHPQLIQTELIELCKSEGIIVMGYSPLGSLVMRFGIDFPGPKMSDPLLMDLARKYGKTSTQIVLRWAVDRGVVPLPKTVTSKYLSQNLDIFDFKLQPEEIDQINKYNTNTRYTIPSFWQDHPFYPFEKIDNPVPNPFTS